jgi:hypothetical protein
MKTKIFLHTEDCVLGSFGDAELHDFLRLDPDRFPKTKRCRPDGAGEWGGAGGDKDFAPDGARILKVKLSNSKL